MGELLGDLPTLSAAHAAVDRPDRLRPAQRFLLADDPRAVLFAQLVDDPSSHPDRFPTEEAQRASEWARTPETEILPRRPARSQLGDCERAQGPRDR